jgi:uncharacterized membrane protein YeiB
MRGRWHIQVRPFVRLSIDAAVSSKRLVSLDAFRGATITGMILVNKPSNWSSVYSQLTALTPDV